MRNPGMKCRGKFSNESILIKPQSIEFNSIDAGLKMYGFSSAKTIAERHGCPVLDVTEYMSIMARMGYVKESRGARGVKLYGYNGRE